MCKTITIPAGERQTYRNKPALWETHAELASQLVDPQNGWRLTAQSNKKALWTCGEHKWESKVGSRSKGSGCPYCSGRKATPETCLATVNPELASQLVDPQDGWRLTAGSKRTALWTCGKHEWESIVSDRSRGNGCPYCSGRIATPETCLAAVDPELASQLVDPQDGWRFTANSGKKTWWRCDCGNQWESAVYSRSDGCGCPKCASSKMNKWSVESCESLGLTFKAEWRTEECRSDRPLPFDVAIFDESGETVACIECQGKQHYEPVRWTKSITVEQAEINLAKIQKHDQIKRDFCEAQGIPLIEIKYTWRDKGERVFKDHLESLIARISKQCSDTQARETPPQSEKN